MHLDLDMGKYVFFVWGSYGATALGLIGLVVLTVRAHAEHKKQLAALQAAQTVSERKLALNAPNAALEDRS